MAITKEQLEEKYKNLPDDVKQTIFSTHVEDIVGEVGKKYSLHIDQMGEVIEEVELVMLGVNHPKDFIEHLGERLGIEDREKIRAIADEINGKIFRSIRESLKKVHGGGPEVLPDQKPKAVQSGYAVPSARLDKGISGQEKTVEDYLNDEPKEVDQKLDNKVGQEVRDSSLVAGKLSGVHNIPKEESSYSVEEKPKDKSNIYTGGADPYREPIE